MTTVRIKIKEHTIINNELLDDIDTLLARLEDFTHGQDGEEITHIRHRLMECIPAERLARKCLQEGSSLGYLEGTNPFYNTQKEKERIINNDIII